MQHALYVAATRAKRFLFLVDTDEGDANVWDYATHWDKINQSINSADKPDEWRNAVGIVQKGTSINIREEAVDLIAQEFEEKGWTSRQPGLLRRAKEFYNAAGMTNRAELCEAKALWIEGNFAQAAKIFLRNGRREEARDCYWDGNLWGDLIDWHKPIKFEHKQHDPYFAIASFLTVPREATDVFYQFLNFLQTMLERGTLGKPFQPQWQIAVQILVDRIQKLRDNLAVPNWSQIAIVLEGIHERGFRFPREDIGLAHYLAGNIEAAVTVWISCDSKPPEYYLAKARLTGYPEGLNG